MHSTPKPNILTINNLLTNSYLRKPCYLKLAIEVGFLGPFTVLLRVLETYHKGTNMYLFVYGTLKSDGSTNLLSASKFISNVTTDDKFALYPNISHSYPCLVKHPLLYIRGELYNVDNKTLTKLDKYEGTPTLFKRIIIDVTDGATTYQAFTYILADLSEADLSSEPQAYWSN